MLQKRDDEYWLYFEDNGVGMSRTVLTGPLIDFGNSFWNSSLAIQEFPGLSALNSRGIVGKRGGKFHGMTVKKILENNIHA